MTKGEKIWNEIKLRGCGEVTTPALIDREMNSAIYLECQKERERLISALNSSNYKKTIPFGLWVVLLVNWIFQPSRTFFSITEGVKKHLIGQIKKN